MWLGECGTVDSIIVNLNLKIGGFILELKINLLLLRLEFPNGPLLSMFKCNQKLKEIQKFMRTCCKGIRNGKEGGKEYSM